jgi:hypothetical protein
MVNLRTRLSAILSWIYLSVLGLLPFHALITTWVGSNFGHLDVWRIWKELVLLATVPVALWLVWQTPKTRYWVSRARLPQLVIVYMIVMIMSGCAGLTAHRVNDQALVYGLFADLRFLGFFLMMAVLASCNGLLRRHWQWFVAVPAVFVVVFGLMQLALPYDFLRHFGYGPSTIPAFQTIDNKLDYQRIQSTLRGANPLGAYLVLCISLLVAMWYKIRRYGVWFAAALLLAVSCLFLTYSRSAYIGAAASLAALLFVVIPRSARLRLAIVAVAVGLVVGGGVFILRDNNLVQNALFHSDETSSSQESSNAGRARAIEKGIYEVLHEPFGRGVGSAGPASARNVQPARISENYFLQIGQEAGWLALGLFIAICAAVFIRLWQLRNTPLALGLLVSFVGLTLINVVSHAWADDTLGLLWWGLAGIAIGSAILKPKH